MHFETSAKNNVGVEDLFLNLTNMVCKIAVKSSSAVHIPKKSVKVILSFSSYFFNQNRRFTFEKKVQFISDTFHKNEFIQNTVRRWL